MRLLLLEDDDGIRTTLRMGLEDEGYEVTEHSRAEAALTHLQGAGADVGLMLVDLMLGGMDGLTFIHRVRQFHDAPIVVVSARDDTYDIVTALEAGADDYVTKPFQLREITARLRALRRRGRTQEVDAGPAVRLDGPPERPLVLWPEAGRVVRGDQPVNLTLTEFRLLCELAAVPGRVLARPVLLERVWDRGFFGDERIVDVHIRRLRTKIERDPADPRVVVTVRGLGYRLDAEPDP
ncbi:response regulator transcription factor [Spongisporangium articulatum]|uniref:Response regulator transcription factor n=1 Tax=Spongisporangium articulatum TaxID=3362603 RepID=A0ABW8AM18_9ACTN